MRTKIKGMVTICTPFNGSRFVTFLIGIRTEMYPNASLIKELLSHREWDNKIITITPSFDTIVWSKHRSHLDGALENIDVKVSGHGRITYDKEAQEKLIQSIEKIAKLG